MSSQGGHTSELGAGIATEQYTMQTAPEHPHILLQPRDLLTLKARESSRVPHRSLHLRARDALNAITAAGPEGEQEIHLEDWFPWREYLAFHAQASEIIGSGITLATA